MNVKLCRVCNEAYNNKFPKSNYDNECSLCRGLSKILIEKGQKIISIAKEKQVKSISFSTAIPSSILNKEDGLLDYEPNGKSIKTLINKKIANYINKNGLEYWSEGDLHFIISEGNLNYEYNDMFIFGRYKKLKPGYSQTRWLCPICHGKGCKECNFTGKKYMSLEELIGERLHKQVKAKNYYIHASGREDVDVCNYAGRPFILQLKQPRVRYIDLDKFREEINNTGIVQIDNLQMANRGDVELVSNSHFDKDYTAVVKFSRPLTKMEEQSINRIKYLLLNQRTPNRVMHRRADLIRKRFIYSVNILNKIDLTTYKIYIQAEAGTYIKEFIHGDKGNTKPSITTLISKDKKLNAICKKLDVSKIHDEFLDDVFKLRNFGN